MRYYLTIVMMLCLISSAIADISPDAIGQPARYQALGLSSSAYQNDIANLFYNPAGIDNVFSLQAISMYTRLLSMVDYKMAGFSFPLWGNTLGFGFNSISIDGVPRVVSFDPQTGNPNLVNSDYSDNLYQLTIARSLDKTLDLPMTLGVSYKRLKQGITAVPQMTADGYAVDVGCIYRLPPSAALSLALKNAASSLLWANGTHETLEQDLLLGATYDLFNSSLTVAGNLDYNLTRASSYFMSGVEYTYKDLYSFRVGYRERPYVSAQNVQAKTSSITVGGGIRVGDLMFDYAYVPYGILSEDGAHYLSMTFSPLLTKTELFRVEVPTYNTIVFLPYVLITGMANHNIASILINDQSVRSDAEVFVHPVTLNVGENRIVVDAVGARGGAYHEESRVFYLKQFQDVPASYKGKLNFDIMYTYDIIRADDQGNFNPKEQIERSGFIAALMKLKGQVTKVYYDKKRKQSDLYRLVSDMLDFDTKDWAAEYLAQAKKDNIVIGYPDLTLRQKNNITRAEAMTIIARVEKLMNKKDDRQLALIPTQDFQVAWIPSDYWSYPYASALKQAGYLDYIEKNRRFIIDYVLEPGDKEKFSPYFIDKYNQRLDAARSTDNAFPRDLPRASSANVFDLLDNPVGASVYEDYLRETDFIKNPINKFELIEMLAKTTFFQTFMKNLGLSNLP